MLWSKAPMPRPIAKVSIVERRRSLAIRGMEGSIYERRSSLDNFESLLDGNHVYRITGSLMRPDNVIRHNRLSGHHGTVIALRSYHWQREQCRRPPTKKSAQRRSEPTETTPALRSIPITRDPRSSRVVEGLCRNDHEHYCHRVPSASYKSTGLFGWSLDVRLISSDTRSKD